MEPAARERLRGLRLVRVVAERRVRAAVHDLADRARRDRHAVEVDDPGLDVDRRPARAAGPFQLLVRTQDRRQRRHLGLPVEVPQRDVREPPLQLAQHLDRHRRGAVVALAQRRQVRRGEVGVAQQRDPHGRRAEELRDPLPRDRREQRRRVGTGKDHAGRAEVDVDGEEAVQLRAVVHRQRVHLDVVRAHPAVDRAADVLADQRAAGEQDALRTRLRARGVHQPHRVVVAHQHVRGLRGADPPPAVDAVPAGGRRRAGRSDPAADRVGHPGVGQRRIHRGDQRVLGDDPPRARVAQDVGDLGRGQHEVDRHQHHAELGRREGDDGELPAVVRQQREAVARPQAPIRERVRGPVDGDRRTPRTWRAGPRRRRRACPGSGARCGAGDRRRRAGGRSRSPRWDRRSSWALSMPGRRGGRTRPARVGPTPVSSGGTPHRGRGSAPVTGPWNRATIAAHELDRISLPAPRPIREES